MRDLFDEFMEELRRREAIGRGEDPDRKAPRRVSPDDDPPDDDDPDDAARDDASDEADDATTLLIATRPTPRMTAEDASHRAGHDRSGGHATASG